jgi:hypothetical protein
MNFGGKKYVWDLRNRASISFTCILAACGLGLASTTSLAQTAVPVPSGDITPAVWDSVDGKWEGGNPSGYAEGETAAMAVLIKAGANGVDEHWTVDICLQVHESPFTAAYAFLKFSSWDMTHLPTCLPQNNLTCQPGITVDGLYNVGASPSWDLTDSNIYLYNADLVSVTPGLAALDHGGCDINYLGLTVHFTISAAQAAAGDSWVVYGGHLAGEGGAIPLGAPESGTLDIFEPNDPIITCPSDVTIECDEDDSPANTGEATAVTDCPDAGFTFTHEDEVTVISDGCPTVQVIARLWTVTDACGNSSSCEQVITVVDNTAPSLTVPDDTTVECTDSTSPSNTGEATGSDTCGSVTITSSDTSVAGCGTTEVITRTWLATDDCGNTTSLAQTITVTDSTPPELSCPASFTVECDSVPDAETPEVTDNCDSVPELDLDETREDGDCPFSYTLTLTWTATDACGNTATCEQLVTLEDTTPPEITCPPDVTISAGTGCEAEGVDLGTPETGDNCGVGSVDNDAPDVFPVGDTTVTWTVVDQCGNSASCEQQVRVEGDTAGGLECPADVTVECDQDTSPASTGALTTDNVCGAVQVSFNDTEEGTCPTVITREWTVIDVFGDESTCEQLITVVDTTPPEFTVPEAVTIECDESTSPDHTGAVTEEVDNCDPSVDVTFSDSVAEGTCPGAAVITRTWTAVDDCENSTSQDQVITVEDTTPPEITCPPDATTNCADSSPTDSGTATVVDNCDDAPTLTYEDVIEDVVDDCPNIAMIVRTWTATDACGNSNSCVQNIAVVDEEAPTVICRNLAIPFVSQVPEGIPTTPEELCAQGIEVFDDCSDSSSLSVEVSPLVLVQEGTDCETDPTTYSRTIQVTDACGNTSECEQLVRIICPSLVTDSSLCTFDFDEKEGRQFRLRNHVDGPEIYRITASNSGQFFYNIFYEGEPGAEVSLLMEIPFPFVTVGGNPVHVYSNVTIAEEDGFLCLDLDSACPDLGDNGDIGSQFLITTEGGNFANSGAAIILLEDYESMADTTWVIIQGVMPESGYLVANIHLDYALKHTTGWERFGENLHGMVGDIPVTIAECQTYTFGYEATGGAEDIVDSDSVQSVNKFMGGQRFGPSHMRGFAGLVQLEDGTPVEGASVTVFSPKGNIDSLGTVLTDSSGFYYLDTKTKYRKAVYDVVVVPFPDVDPDFMVTDSIMVKPNGFGMLNFTIVP